MFWIFPLSLQYRSWAPSLVPRDGFHVLPKNPPKSFQHPIPGGIHFLIDLLMDLIIHFGSNLGPNLSPCWQPTWAHVGSQVGAKVNKRIHQQIYQFRSKRDSTNPRQFPRRVWARFLRFPKRARARCWRVWG